MPSLTNSLAICLRRIFLTLTSQASRRITQQRLLFSACVTEALHTAKALISACLADISAWMSAHHLKLGKTELLFPPGKACPLQDLSITIDNSTVSPSQSAKNLGVTLDILLFSANIKAVTRSCRFMLYNILDPISHRC